MQVTFIDADRSNIEAIVNFMSEYYAYDHIPFDRKSAFSSLEQLVTDHSLGRAWMIRYGDDTVGYCVLTLGYSLEFRGKTAFIDELFVKKEHRGKGIGTRALIFLKDTAREMGVTALRLEVERKNVDARGLYKKAGFGDEDRDLMTYRIAKDRYFA